MISVGVIGYGYWGPNVVRNFAELPDARVAWVTDLRADRLASVGTRYPAVKVSTNHHDVINDPSVDAVVIATPVRSPATHRRRKHHTPDEERCQTNCPHEGPVDGDQGRRQRGARGAKRFVKHAVQHPLLRTWLRLALVGSRAPRVSSATLSLWPMTGTSVARATPAVPSRIVRTASSLGIERIRFPPPQ